MYPIPPWLAQPADPAAHYATGLQIGAKIGAEQAAQRYQQQQMLRAQIQDEFERAYKTEVLNLEVDKAVRKQRAQLGFQAAVAQGVDPMQALMTFGPDMGESMGDVIRGQELAAQRQITNQIAQTRLAGEQRSADLRERELIARGELAQNQLDVRKEELEERRQNRERLEGRLNLSDTERRELDRLYSRERSVEEQLDKLAPLLAKDEDEETLANRDYLQRELGLVRKKIERFGKAPVQAAPAPAATPAPAAPGAPAIAPGNIVKQGGKRYRFNGGDPADPANYTEL